MLMSTINSRSRAGPCRTDTIGNNHLIARLYRYALIPLLSEACQRPQLGGPVWRETRSKTVVLMQICKSSRNKLSYYYSATKEGLRHVGELSITQVTLKEEPCILLLRRHPVPPR